MTESPTGIVEARRKRLSQELGRALTHPTAPPDLTPLTEKRKVYLMEEAQDLYWNELEWERVTDEEQVDGEPLAELIFPGFLAFIRGLLLEEVPADSLAGPQPRPEVVEDIILFLAHRLVDLRSEVNGANGDREQRQEEEVLTSRLLDLTLREYHGVSSEEVEGGAGR